LGNRRVKTYSGGCFGGIRPVWNDVRRDGQLKKTKVSHSFGFEWLSLHNKLPWRKTMRFFSTFLQTGSALCEATSTHYKLQVHPR